METLVAPAQRTRDQIEDRFKWNLTHIFPDWDAWQRGYDMPDVVRQGVYRPYVRALQQALAEVRRSRPFFLSGFKWPYRQELMNDLRRDRFMWV